MDDFYLFANCNFVPDKYNDWQHAYDPLGSYVYSHEPSTKTYYFGLPLPYSRTPSLTTSMLAFEIYTSRSALYDTHLHSPAMTAFLEKIPAASTTGLDLNHYGCVAGFLDSTGGTGKIEEGNGDECGVMQDVRIRCRDGEARGRVREGLEGLVGHVERSAREKEDGVLTYMAFVSLDDEVGLRIFGRWRTREDMERFIRREDVNAFWMASKGWIVSMEQQLYAPNGKGWLHRGSGYAGKKGTKTGGDGANL